MKPVPICALIVAVALVTAGCSSDGYVDGPVLTSARPPLFGGGGMDAVVAGTLAFEDECLYLVSGDIAYPVLWPHGAAWQPDPPAVILSGRVLEPGMSVSGGGGFVALARDHLEAAGGAKVADAAEGCADLNGELAVFNSGSTIDVDPGDD